MCQSVLVRGYEKDHAYGVEQVGEGGSDQYYGRHGTVDTGQEEDDYGHRDEGHDEGTHPQTRGEEGEPDDYGNGYAERCSRGHSRGVGLLQRVLHKALHRGALYRQGGPSQDGEHYAG